MKIIIPRILNNFIYYYHVTLKSKIYKITTLIITTLNENPYTFLIFLSIVSAVSTNILATFISKKIHPIHTHCHLFLSIIPLLHCHYNILLFCNK